MSIHTRSCQTQRFLWLISTLVAITLKVSAAMAGETHWEVEIASGPPSEVVTVDSSAELDLHLDATTEGVDLFITSGPGEVVLTISGLNPYTTYHRYTDEYRNHETINIDASGSYSLILDTSGPRALFIQTQPSTKFIVDDGILGTGGDCASVGNWDGSTKTCTLTNDVTETIQISSSGITLDCNNRTVTGPGFGNGILVPFQNDVSIRACDVSGFRNGALAFVSNNVTFEDNNAHSNLRGALFVSSSSNVVTNNVLSSNTREGVFLSSSNSDQIIGNTVSDNGRVGIRLLNSNSAIVLNNLVTDNPNGGIGALFGSGVEISSNTLSGNGNQQLPSGFQRNGAIGIESGASYVLSGNVMNDNAHGLGVKAAFDHDIDTTNTVNGKKIYYFSGYTGTTVSPITHPDAAAVYCISCNDVVIRDFVLDSGNWQGIVIVDNTNSTIEENVIFNSARAIVIPGSIGTIITRNSLFSNTDDAFFHGITADFALPPSNSVISENTISASIGHRSIDLSFQSNENTIVGNNLSGSTDSAIRVAGDRNVIEENRISDSGLGVEITIAGATSSDGNTVRNNMIADARLSLFAFAPPPGRNGPNAEGGILIADQGVFGSATNTLVTRNTVKNMIGRSITVQPADTIVTQNDFLGNSNTLDKDGNPVTEVFSPVPLELSINGVGNYWGRNCGIPFTPLFQPGVNSNDVSVSDSFAFRHPVAEIEAEQGLIPIPCPTQ